MNAIMLSGLIYIGDFSIVPPNRLVLLCLILSPILLNCKGQYEHFRNHESVFKNYHPYFEGSGKNITSIAGQTVTLACDVRNLGDRYVSWLRGTDLQVISSGWTKFTGDRRVSIMPADRSHTWKLVIRNISPKDSGQYLCQVNTEPKISQINYLKVAESFADIKGNSERGVQKGSSLELICHISQSIPLGENAPAIIWSRDNFVIGKSDKIDITQGLLNPGDKTMDSRLKIENVQPGDAGVYSCKLQGAAEAKVTVLVTSGEQRAAILDENGSNGSQSIQHSSLLIILLLWSHFCAHWSFVFPLLL